MIVFQTPVATPEHNSLAVRIGTYLEKKISSKHAVLYDTYCYISHEILEKLGHLKNGDLHEYMQTRLIELGASNTFVAETLSWLLKQGTMPSSYAPDIAVINEQDYDNRFRIPLWIGEIVSKDSRDYDLYFKAYLYERLGVKEYFIFNTGHRSGNLVRIYCLQPDSKILPQYKITDFTETAATVHSEILQLELPINWTV